MSKLKRSPEAPVVNDSDFEVIEDFGVPPRQRTAGESKYPVAKLAVGAAIVSDKEEVVRNAKVAASVHAKRLLADTGVAKKFVTRKKQVLDEDGNVAKIQYALIRES
jgi:hypothetical protein